MDILKKNYIYKKENTLFLSKTPKILFDKKYETKVFNIKNYNQKIINDISSFVEYNYSKNMLKSLPVNLPVENIKKYFNIGASLEIISDENNSLGVNLGFYIPVDVKTELDKTFHIDYPNDLKSLCYKDSIIIGYSTYLVIDKKQRNKNIGKNLLFSGIKNLYDNGGLIFIGSHDKKRTINPVEYNVWYYPLNFNILDKIKYLYPYNYKSLFKLDPEMNEINEINESNIIKAYDFYLNKTENKKFAFKPSFVLWKKWIKSFHTYLILKNDNIIGLFSYEIIKTHNREHDIFVNKCNMLICIGPLKAALFHIKLKADIVFMNELGDITETNLLNIYAQKSFKRYLNIYNIRIKLDKSDICLPLF